MKRDELKDLAAFLAIAEAQGFTLAAARLGMSPSALSRSTRGLEACLGVRLLARSTRNVRPTQAGDRLLRVLQPTLADVVRSGHDAGIRMGHTVERDTISVQVGPDIPALVVGSPDHLTRHGVP